ncbi:unnamed protein product [Dovyalis caffra]|uniref:Peptidase A1 domain-containing protein n=1 Tax=Dovyalis caffra TaxID=77055 RepID=A0AAV1RP23_9ROSI|nr:unnamed protein product [Dovyalis caffra]
MKSGIPFHGLSKATATDYVVNVGLGTPKKEFPLLFDTGSGLIWTQCKPCKPCYRNAPVFDPTKSTSFKPIPCSSKQCQTIEDAECSSSKCSYKITYVDNDTCKGIYAMETISFKPLNYEFKNILIGCSDQISGDLDEENSGAPSSTGYLTFGSEVSKDVKFSPVSKRAPPSDYDIEMTGIRVGGRTRLIDTSVFKIRCTIDSGTVFTYLPPKAYSVLRSMFREMMKGEVEVDIDVSGIMVRVDESKEYCLAFAALDDEVAVLGNTQQRTYTVVYDGAKERIGFAPGGCD